MEADTWKFAQRFLSLVLINVCLYPSTRNSDTSRISFPDLLSILLRRSIANFAFTRDSGESLAKTIGRFRDKEIKQGNSFPTNSPISASSFSLRILSETKNSEHQKMLSS